MIRAVLDTNILISALLFKGIPGQLLEFAIAGSFRAVTSPTLLDELDEKLRGKFQLRGTEADQYEATWKISATWSAPSLTLKPSKTIRTTIASWSARLQAGQTSSSAEIATFSSLAHSTESRFSPSVISWTESTRPPE